LEKNIRVTFTTPIQIGPEGVKIDVYSKPVAIAGAGSSARMHPIALKTVRLSAGAPIHYSVDAAGMASMELFTVNGARIGTIMQEKVASGAHSFMWNGKTVDGKQVGSAFVLLRLSTQTGSVTQSVITGR
jgi:flagellar hook assembly protein FlgD